MKPTSSGNKKCVKNTDFTTTIPIHYFPPLQHRFVKCLCESSKVTETGKLHVGSWDIFRPNSENPSTLDSLSPGRRHDEKVGLTEENRREVKTNNEIPDFESENSAKTPTKPTLKKPCHSHSAFGQLQPSRKTTQKCQVPSKSSPQPEWLATNMTF